MTAEEYTKKEKRLSEIEQIFIEMKDSENFNIPDVISLRNEAKEIGLQLNSFISENFSKK